MVTVLQKLPPTDASNRAFLDSRNSLSGLNREALALALTAIGVPPKHIRMRVNQLWRWIYISGVTSFDQMTDMTKELRGLLDAAYTLARPEIVTEQISVDGTRKSIRAQKK